MLTREQKMVQHKTFRAQTIAGIAQELFTTPLKMGEDFKAALHENNTKGYKIVTTDTDNGMALTVTKPGYRLVDRWDILDAHGGPRAPHAYEHQEGLTTKTGRATPSELAVMILGLDRSK